MSSTLGREPDLILENQSSGGAKSSHQTGSASAVKASNWIDGIHPQLLNAMSNPSLHHGGPLGTSLCLVQGCIHCLNPFAAPQNVAVPNPFVQEAGDRPLLYFNRSGRLSSSQFESVHKDDEKTCRDRLLPYSWSSSRCDFAGNQNCIPKEGTRYPPR